MSYLYRGTGYSANAVTVASSKKSYILGSYSAATINRGADNIGERIYADGGIIESYSCAVDLMRDLRETESPTYAANTLFASAITDGAEVEAVECFYNSYKELENIDII
jgi:hypothetical protein